jgi:hypothetical protein
MRKLLSFTVQRSPSGHAGLYVAKKFDFEKDTGELFSNASLEEVRSWIRHEAGKAGNFQPYKIPRRTQDESTVIENWI